MEELDYGLQKLKNMKDTELSKEEEAVVVGRCNATKE